MENSQQKEQFVQVLTSSQNRLYGYVFSLLGDHSRTLDVVQETNLVLWRRIEEFDPERPFAAWAFGIARMQVLAHLRDNKRDRLLLDAELAESLATEVESHTGKMDSYREALRNCMATLKNDGRELIEGKYIRSMTISDLAQSRNKSVGAIKVSLMRVRKKLLECLQKRIALESQ